MSARYDGGRYSGERNGDVATPDLTASPANIGHADRRSRDKSSRMARTRPECRTNGMDCTENAKRSAVKERSTAGVDRSLSWDYRTTGGTIGGAADVVGAEITAPGSRWNSS